MYTFKEIDKSATIIEQNIVNYTQNLTTASNGINLKKIVSGSISQSYWESLNVLFYTSGSSTYGSATYGGQSEPLFRQPIEGSGFAVALRVVDSGVSSPYSLKGFQLEFDAGARR